MVRVPIRVVDDPPNPWRSQHVELLGDEPATLDLRVYEEEARSALSHNDSDDVGFDWSVNPYRGCFHACAYCYARPSHEWLDWGAGADFERRIVVKTNAAALLRRELLRPSWRGETIAFSGVTDAWQPVEASYGVTRACLEVCAELGNPATAITKGALVERDFDLFARLVGDGAGAFLWVSVPFADETTARALEPTAATPERRWRIIERARAAGIPVGVSLSPLIPGLNDHQIPELLARAAAAGAEAAFVVLLRLPGSVRAVFDARLRDVLPERADKVFKALAEVRGGADRIDEARIGHRGRGVGARWQMVRALFEAGCRKHGLRIGRGAEAIGRAKRLRRPEQGELFPGGGSA
jgi:DNA repair photolyase